MPRGAVARLTVTGPKVNKIITKSATLSKLAAGRFTVTAATVPAPGGTAVPSPAVKTVAVKAKKTTKVTISYRFVPTPVVPPPGPTVSAPGAPSGVVGVAGDGQVALTWAVPASNGGAVITDYRVQYSSNGTTWTTFPDGVSSTPVANVTGLANSTSYTFRVAAINSAGTGADSAPSAAAVPLPPADCAHPGPGKNLSYCDFRGVNLSMLSRGDLTGANLTGADLTDAMFEHGSMNGANLTGAILTGLSLWDMNASGIIGVPAALPSEHYRLINGYLIGSGVCGLDTTGMDLSEAADALSGMCPGGVTGTPVALPAGWRLVSGYFLHPNANLRGADLHDVDLSGLDLSGVDLGQDPNDGAAASLRNMNLTGTNLTGARMTQAQFDHVDLTNANLLNADMHGTWISNSNLTDANLTNVDMRGDVFSGSISDSNLTNADLTGADLTGIDSWGITGTPAHLPAGWSIVGGVLVHA
ncbi:MAG: pentapeptide repeat-containing protein [Actinomycetes bacterium]